METATEYKSNVCSYLEDIQNTYRLMDSIYDTFCRFRNEVYSAETDRYNSEEQRNRKETTADTVILSVSVTLLLIIMCSWDNPWICITGFVCIGIIGCAYTGRYIKRRKRIARNTAAHNENVISAQQKMSVMLERLNTVSELNQALTDGLPEGCRNPLAVYMMLCISRDRHIEFPDEVAGYYIKHKEELSANPDKEYRELCGEIYSTELNLKNHSEKIAALAGKENK